MIRPLILVLSLLSMPALAAEPATLTVTGTGAASAAPDTATIRIGVETQGDTAAAALDANSAQAAALIAEAKARGVESRDIQTSGLSLYPVYDQRSPDRNEAPMIAGYNVSNEVAIRLRDMASVGETLGALVGAGANQMRGITFEIEDDTALLDEARKLAVVDARRKAEVYATAAGVKLGAIQSISEAGESAPHPGGPMMRSMAADSVPVEAGENALSVSVQVVWAIE
jgi:uncharacterized protein YggE